MPQQQKRAKKIYCLKVTSPAALKAQWKREWYQASDREIKIVEGNPDERKKIYLDRSSSVSVLVMNYELLLRDMDLLLKLKPEAIILDEAQRIKNYATQTAQQVKRLKPPFRLILTGTPMENRIQDLVSLMDWIDDHAMGPGWRLDSELRLDDAGSGHRAQGVRGLGLIRERIRPHFLRRLRSEVLKDLPARTDSPIIIPFSDEQRIIHDDIGKKVARLIAQASRRPLTPEEHIRLMSYLTQMRIVSNALTQFEYDEFWPSLQADKNPVKRLPHLSSPKLSEFRNLIEGLLTQDGLKIVVFSQWQRMLRLCHWAIDDLLQQEDLEAVFFTGKESQKRRTENIVRFHDDPSVRIFFATDAGGVGLNLQRAATVCINLELPWNPAVLEQRIGRIYRLGQDKPVQIFNLITEKSIEERITALVGKKRAVFKALFDGDSDQIQFDENSNFYGQVQKVIQDMKIKVDDIPDTEEDSAEEDARPLEISDEIEVDEVDTPPLTTSEQQIGTNDIM